MPSKLTQPQASINNLPSAYLNVQIQKFYAQRYTLIISLEPILYIQHARRLFVLPSSFIFFFF
uniref:Uncharacterized protein n=1 Tax=Rhizophora mucronata TaxID=61149 RepID=A0A2P2L8Q6_RHIMU